MRIDGIIVGGGAAGCYAAITAARRGRQILLLEQNERVGMKLGITGKGRCNLTNACDLPTFTAHIVRNARFMYSSLSGCMPEDIMSFFEEAGVPLKIERGQRVFPVSDRASDIVQACMRIMKMEGVRRKQVRVDALCIENGRCTGVRAGKETFSAEHVLLATGGASYPKTGSTGDGYRLAQQAGHTVLPPLPSLVPLETMEQYPAELSGLSLKNVRLTVFRGQDCCFSEQGEMLFTHFGISGPLVLSASANMDVSDACSYRFEIDMKPALSLEQVDAGLQRDWLEQPNRCIGNALSKRLPSSLIPVVLRLATVDGKQPVHDVTRTQRQRIATIFKALPLTCRGTRPLAEAIVTRGGVDVREVNPKTMESKLVSGLFFSGELLDVDALTGGFNLQIAFATGHAAGFNL